MAAMDETEPSKYTLSQPHEPNRTANTWSIHIQPMCNVYIEPRLTDE